MTLLVLVRHGEAAAADDTDDTELSDRGRRQVAALAERLRGQTFSALCHSPRRRAAQTAELLCSGIPLEPTELLNDRTPVPSANRRTAYSASQLAWLAGVPAEERDLDGADLDHAWFQLTTEVTERGPLLAVMNGTTTQTWQRRADRDSRTSHVHRRPPARHVPPYSQDIAPASRAEPFNSLFD